MIGSELSQSVFNPSQCTRSVHRAKGYNMLCDAEKRPQNMDFGINVLEIWRATMVRRWHSNPDMAWTDDPIGGHSGRVALLICVIFEGASSSLLRAALFHDLGESGGGDVSADAKREDPDLKVLLDVGEERRMRRMGISHVALDPLDRRRLKLADRLDAFLWMRFKNPNLEQRDDWQRDLKFLQTEGADLGIGPDCGGVL